jgi:DNA (cytosine-5)-methyltransferase 1
MTHGSLFSGIGGFDLAAEWAGWENVFHCEWNEFGQKVLKYHFPQSITYNDITKTDFTIHRGQIDVLTGGFPCQPYSSAGKRLGTADNRHLWPEMLRAIREIQPRWIVGENVRGLTNWNGGMVFDEVQLNLEVEGYEVIPFLLPACAVNAPHRRDRIWFIAYTDSNGSIKCNSNNEVNTNKRGINAQCNFDKGFVNGNVTDTDIARIHKQHTTPITNQKKQYSRNSFKERCFSTFPTEPPICGTNDGISKELDGITFSKWRNETIKAYGNAIVPQVAYQIFNSINEYEKGH